MVIAKYLEDLAEQIEESVETDLYNQWEQFTQGQFTGQIFVPERKKTRLPAEKWPQININETLDDL